MLSKAGRTLIGVALLAVALNQCRRDEPGAAKESEMAKKPIAEVLKAHTEHLMSLPGVVGTAEGELNGKPCIKVLVAEKTDELSKKIPAELESYPVVVVETGEFKALDKSGDD
jgi:hypothetical protein